MAQQRRPTPQERAVLELLDTGAWITVDSEGPGPRVRIEGGIKNPPSITRTDLNRLLDAEWVYRVWDEEEVLDQPKYIISALGRQYLEDNPSPASAAPAHSMSIEAAAGD